MKQVTIDIDLEKFDELYDKNEWKVLEKTFPQINKDEVYTHIISCPNCKNREIFLWHHYCPICGCKIVFSEKMSKYIKDHYDI